MTTGYITLTQLADLKLMTDKMLLDSSRIKDLINSDLASVEKKHMSEGSKYYAARHDILDNRQYYWVDGVKVEDQVKSNYRIPHPFHKILVEQKASYIAGNPIVVSIYEPEEGEQQTDEFQTMLMDTLGHSFDDLVNDWIIGASNHGQEWVHFYIAPDGKLKWIVCPGEQIIPVYDTQYQEKLVYVIRFYVYELVNERGERFDRYKVEWWSATDVRYWAQQMNEMFILDPDYPVNPGPHWFEVNTSAPGDKALSSWGRVPFVRLANNSGLQTDLQPIKALIDAYDKVKSGWINDLVDFQELIYVLKGYEALTSEAQKGFSELAIFMQNLKTHKVISVSESGSVETLKAEIPIEAKEKFLAITRKEIFYFGEGVDVDNEKFNTPSGIALKFLYTSLDLKANRLIRKLKVALEDFMWFVVEFINRSEKRTFDSEEIQFTFNKSVIFNEAEKVQELAASEGMLSKQTILENHPLVDDAEEEMRRLEAEREERVKRGEVDLTTVDPNAEDANAPAKGE